MPETCIRNRHSSKNKMFSIKNKLFQWGREIQTKFYNFAIRDLLKWDISTQNAFTTLKNKNKNISFYYESS